MNDSFSAPNKRYRKWKTLPTTRSSLPTTVPTASAFLPTTLPTTYRPRYWPHTDHIPTRLHRPHTDSSTCFILPFYCLLTCQFCWNAVKGWLIYRAGFAWRRFPPKTNSGTKAMFADSSEGAWGEGVPSAIDDSRKEKSNGGVALTLVDPPSQKEHWMEVWHWL